MANYRAIYFKENKGFMGKYQCVKCKGWFPKEQIDVDHIIPQKYIKIDNAANLQAMCQHCNRSKGANTDNVVVDLVKQNTKRAVKGAIKGIFNSIKK